ncbi:MAG: DEAD/DEAH box helicase [Opitutaceae bacterium]|nr:DEAD/DEAH box helicase [Opitutaceae bacterium]
MRLDELSSLQQLVLPDRWQAEAIQALRAGKDVIVDAPTGAGKTYVFERWAEQTNFSRRALFTVPTRALANDKYAEWRERGWRVGITTGDLTIDSQAPLVVATLEAVQHRVAAPRHESGGDTPPEFRLLVVDEYQWLADEHRGSHYEGVLLSAARGLQLLLLSGAVGNPEDVAAWLRRLGRDVVVVQTRRRPVPLEEVEADDLVRGLPRTVEGFWSRRVAGALREGLGPVLVFAPHRSEVERLARQFARELPLPDPLTLSQEQESVCGPGLAKLLKARVAFHHSGLTYAQRAGVIEPLAKAGQLRAVVATLGLSAGINFSLRSVMITAGSYRHGQREHEIEPHELLQMAGRAGRRGLDEMGYVLVSSSTPRLRRAAQMRLKRAGPLPWAFMLRQLRAGENVRAVTAAAAHRFFTEQPMVLGAEQTGRRRSGGLPCDQRTDTGRARLVRRERNPFPACRTCAHRAECLALSPQPTLLWQLQRVGVLDQELRLTARGEIVSNFLGPEGLAIAAALEDRAYPLDAIVFDIANITSGERFSGTNPRVLGRLSAVCERTYRRQTIEGYLENGIPPQYGFGAADVVKARVEGERLRALVDAQETAGRGDIDRLMTEWRSLLKQIASASPISETAVSHGSCSRQPGGEAAAIRLMERWDNLRSLAHAHLSELRPGSLPELPALLAEQRRPINHRFHSRTHAQTMNPLARRPAVSA